MRVATVLVAGLLAVAAVAAASNGFSDPRGDAGSGPDITNVTLSHAGPTVTIAVEFASTPPLAFSETEGYTDMLLVGIHTDRDLSRTDVEFWTGVHGVDLTRAMVVRAGEERGLVGMAEVTVSGPTVALEVGRDLLGDPDEIAVAVAAGRESAEEEAAGGDADEAPSSGAFTYALEDGGSPPWLWPGVGVGAAGLVALSLFVAARRAVRSYGTAPSHDHP